MRVYFCWGCGSSVVIVELRLSFNVVAKELGQNTRLLAHQSFKKIQAATLNPYCHSLSTHLMVSRWKRLSQLGYFCRPCLA